MTHYLSSLLLCLGIPLLLWLSGCDSSSPTRVHPVTHSSSSDATVEQVLVQGRVTFDQIPNDDASGHLLFDEIYPAPVKQALIDAVSLDGNTLYFSSITSATGEYALLVPSNTQVQIRVWAIYENIKNASWRAQVVDNTQGDRTYALLSDAINTGNSNKTVDIHASSGFGGDTYKTVRSSAPFAILNALYDGFELVAEQYNGPFPELTVAWSTNNIAITSNDPNAIKAGFIGSSFYINQDSAAKIFLLGHVDNDADDYDRSVILHEFGHFIMDNLSRSDSVGGSYSPGAKLDMRVSFNEAMSNVFAAMIDQQPNYRDVFGAQQALVQSFNIEDQQANNSNGWYSIESLSWLLNDMIDEQDDGLDTIALGWDGLYQILTHPSILHFDGVMSIYPILATARELFPSWIGTIDGLATQQQIQVTDAYGTEEINNGGNGVTLPLYHFLPINESQNFCSQAQAQEFNGFDVRRFIQFEIPFDGIYTITASKQGGNLSVTNPDFVAYQNGAAILQGRSPEADLESSSYNLSAGSFVLDLFEKSNADENESTGGLACFDVKITPGESTNAQIFSNSTDCASLASLSGDDRCQLANPSRNQSIAF